MDFQALLLTPAGTGAIAVVLATGADAAGALGLLGVRTDALQPGDIRRVTLRHEDHVLDDGLVVCREAEQFELHLHGGVAVVDAVLGALAKLGGQIPAVDSSEAITIQTSGRAMTAIGREVFAAIPKAPTMTAVRLLAAQETEGLTAWAQQWLKAVDGLRSIWPLHSAAQWLLERSRALRQVVAPVRVAIVGPPNAGKSTLANTLLGRPVSITSTEPGTTRDWVEETAVLTDRAGNEAAVVLVDTAGLRETEDPIERESMVRTGQQVRAAAAVIAVLDGSVHADAKLLNSLAAVEESGRPLVVAVNKSDLPRELQAADMSTSLRQVALSALEHKGVDGLMNTLFEVLELGELNVSEAAAFTPRQAELVEQLALSEGRDQARKLLQELLG